MQMSFVTSDSYVNTLTVADFNLISRAVQGDTHRFELIERFIKLFVTQSPNHSIEMAAMRLVIGVIKRQFPKVPVMTTNELHQLMKTTTPAPRKLVLLDTREEKEFKVSHLAKAIHLNPKQTDMSRVIDMIHQKAGPPHEPKTVVCYCAVGYRASIMANRLIEELQKPENQELKAHVDVYNLEGSIFKWGNERKDLVEPSGQSTTLINTVSPFWGLLVYKEMRARAD